MLALNLSFLLTTLLHGTFCQTATTLGEQLQKLENVKTMVDANEGKRSYKVVYESETGEVRGITTFDPERADMVKATTNLQNRIRDALNKIERKQMSAPVGRQPRWKGIPTNYEGFMKALNSVMDQLRTVIAISNIRLDTNLTSLFVSSLDWLEATEKQIRFNRSFTDKLHETAREIDRSCGAQLHRFVDGKKHVNPTEPSGVEFKYSGTYEDETGTAQTILTNDPMEAEFINELGELKKYLKLLVNEVIQNQLTEFRRHPPIPEKRKPQESWEKPTRSKKRAT